MAGKSSFLIRHLRLKISQIKPIIFTSNASLVSTVTQDMWVSTLMTPLPQAAVQSISYRSYLLNITAACPFPPSSYLREAQSVVRAGVGRLQEKYQRILEPHLVTLPPPPYSPHLPVLHHAPAVGCVCPPGPQGEQHPNCG